MMVRRQHSNASYAYRRKSYLSFVTSALSSNDTNRRFRCIALRSFICPSVFLTISSICVLQGKAAKEKRADRVGQGRDHYPAVSSLPPLSLRLRRRGQLPCIDLPYQQHPPIWEVTDS